ncbi:DinB family protein [Kribbella sp. NBC_00889]|uniref:DinB family protein n=1 Tax=Kribbella sp. NBC_00889 TaxID=2975974 RepID=UPI00386FD0AD|nr:DinB family protein [Kribbella sp. NBC_00889]
MDLFDEDLARTAGEREVLEAFLDAHRRVAVDKLRGLSEADARRRLVPSLTTPIGLVNHLAGVERNWFQHSIAQRPREEIAGDARGGEQSWTVADDVTIDDIIAAYEEACAESRRIAADLPLDHVVPHERLGEVSLRWVYVHMIREHARHGGHADILRERLDGATGA